MNHRAVLTISSGRKCYFVFIPSNGSPKEVADSLESVLADVKPTAGGHFDSSLLTTHFLLKHGNQARLIDSDQTIFAAHEYRYVVTMSAHLYQWRIAAYVSKPNGVFSASPDFNGSFADFKRWQSGPFHDSVGKIVTFVYGAGSKPGSKRLVKVESIDSPSRGQYILKGLDLEKLANHDDDAFRQFKSSEIISEVSIVL